jgi:hypothetical protein
LLVGFFLCNILVRTALRKYSILHQRYSYRRFFWTTIMMRLRVWVNVSQHFSWSMPTDTLKNFSQFCIEASTLDVNAHINDYEFPISSNIWLLLTFLLNSQWLTMENKKESSRKYKNVFFFFSVDIIKHLMYHYRSKFIFITLK